MCSTLRIVIIKTTGRILFPVLWLVNGLGWQAFRRERHAKGQLSRLSRSPRRYEGRRCSGPVSLVPLDCTHWDKPSISMETTKRLPVILWRSRIRAIRARRSQRDLSDGLRGEAALPSDDSHGSSGLKSHHDRSVLLSL